jgi:hypothetical protein
MTRRYLLPENGNFYKANLHSHGTYSDGALTPECAKELYKNEGYSIYAYTEHNQLNYFKELNDDDFLVLCGFELHVANEWGGDVFEKNCHINAIARDPDNAVYIDRPQSYDPDEINRVIKELIDANYIVNYNHPSWSSEEPSDYLQLEGFTAMEIYNSNATVVTNNGRNDYHYDVMLRHGKKLFCIATDDNHNSNLISENYRRSDSFGGWTVFKAPVLTYTKIIEAFDAGNFYCSTGPEIFEYYIEDNKICIKCSPISVIYIKNDETGALDRAYSENNDMEYFEYDFAEARERSKYIRFELVDANGHTAYTNPIYFS